MAGAEDRWERLRIAAVALLTLTLLTTTFAMFVPWRASVHEFSGQGDFREIYLPWGVEYRVNLPGRTLLQDSRTYWDDDLYRTTVTRSEDDGQVVSTREVKPEIRFLLQTVMPLEIAGLLLALAASALWVLAPTSVWRSRLAALSGSALLLGLVFLLVGTHFLLEGRGTTPAASFWIALPATGALAALLAAALPLLEGTREEAAA